MSSSLYAAADESAEQERARELAAMMALPLDQAIGELIVQVADADGHLVRKILSSDVTTEVVPTTTTTDAEPPKPSASDAAGQIQTSDRSNAGSSSAVDLGSSADGLATSIAGIHKLLVSAAGESNVASAIPVTNQLALLDGAGVTRVGGSGDDVLVGTAGDDVLKGGAGNDQLSGLAGNDMLMGEEGNDTLNGGAGADLLDGGAGKDTATYAQASAGVIVDLSAGGYGGEATGDVYQSIEDVVGSAYADTLTGDSSDNAIAAGAGADLLYGGGGNDVLQGGTGADLLDGGAGVDVACYDDASAGVVVDLSTGGSGGEATGDVYQAIEAVVGSAYDDTITGTSGDNQITGGAGADLLYGGAGNDALEGGTAADLINGEAGFDYAIYENARNGVTVVLATGGTGGEAAGDRYVSIEGVVGSDHADVIIAGDGDNVLVGGLGADILAGGAGVDAFYFGTSAECGDQILDFDVKHDRIVISAHGFDGELTLGELTADRFVFDLENVSSDTNQFIWDSSTSTLYWIHHDQIAQADEQISVAMLSSGTMFEARNVFVVE